MQRLHQVILCASTVLLSWLGMMAVHEFGHVLGAWITGGEVERVVVHPLRFSRTDLSHNPAPLVVVWMGPFVGVALPLLLWLIAWLVKMPGHYVLRFFAGFCLLANGAYLGFGTFDRIGDVGEMLAHGTSLWVTWLFAGVCMPMGLCIWHGLGAHFGAGAEAKPIDGRVAYGTLAVTLLALVLAVLL